MKISYLISSIGAGGKERQLIYLLDSLSANNTIQVFVFNENIFFKEIFNLNLELVLIKKRSKYSTATLRKVYYELHRFKPDIIHSWDNISHCLALPYILLHKTRVVNGSVRYAGYIKKSAGARLIQKLAFKTSDAIVSNSKQGLAVEKLSGSTRAITIYNGIDVSRDQSKEGSNMREAESCFSGFSCNVVMVGRFYPAKDYRTFIRAAISVLSINDRIGFYLIGDGPGRTEAERYADNWLNKNIFFLGQRSDVHGILHNFDIGVLLNNINGHAEGISNALMEFMAAGLPVIATDAGGTPELVSDDATGYLVPAFDHQYVTDRILCLILNKEKRKELGVKGREIIERDFSIKKMVDNYSGLYNKLIS